MDFKNRIANLKSLVQKNVAHQRERANKPISMDSHDVLLEKNFFALLNDILQNILEAIKTGNKGSLSNDIYAALKENKAFSQDLIIKELQQNLKENNHLSSELKEGVSHLLDKKSDFCNNLVNNKIDDFSEALKNGKLNSINSNLSATDLFKATSSQKITSEIVKKVLQKGA
ncbi:hypothetical protein CCZ01_09210 [Helicobacter monodelphidis]|uniref:hypothetical protein n=1 Tax=Helicobacter sp. 15-1451 TaxID=2004995 RepID=UPI000DCD6530|nr:hypothetical protein [Helicobacter sp. 15-1451]RAX56542.1 hypothetical protein CCZ01_09210 [Helicobacter sp. 15-1451]